jgi:hypothetical protein
VGRRRVVLLAWTLWALTMLAMSAFFWLQQERQGPLDATHVALLLATVSAATVGAALASRRPHHPVGWLLLSFGLSVIVSGVADGYAAVGEPYPGRYAAVGEVYPSRLPAARFVALCFPTIIVTAQALLGFVLLLTPTGSLPSACWRWWARTTAAAPVVSLLAIMLASQSFDQPDQAIEVALNPLNATSGVVLPVGFQLAYAVTSLAVVVGAASLVVRFRRARGIERQQLRWVALAAVPVALGSVVAALTTVVALPADALIASPVFLGLAVGIYVLPLAIGAAILRYRLYDLDRIISRTLAYGLLTVLLGGGYAAVVLGLGQLLPQDSSLVVAGATLAVAAVFQPARRRIQAAVDRRFNRRRYDAARTIAAFSTRLREQVDLDTLAAELLAVVDQTMQPASASLWLRPPPARARPLSGIDT